MEGREVDCLMDSGRFDFGTFATALLRQRGETLEEKACAILANLFRRVRSWDEAGGRCYTRRGGGTQ
jgi:hypothetical protein